MKPYYEDRLATIYHSDCRDILSTLPKASAIVTDPPYELGFMGKSWDSKGISFQKETWGIVREACLSGAMLLSFGGTRTFHRIACAIENAGWEYRDTLMWVYGSGFPKSLDISKAIDKVTKRIDLFEPFARHFKEQRILKGLSHKDIARYFPSKTNGLTGCVWNWENAMSVPTMAQWHILKPLLDLMDDFLPLIQRLETEREIVGKGHSGLTDCKFYGEMPKEYNITTPATPEAQLWNGYGTALKPAYEPIILAMNPLDGTFANNALKHGVAGLNIDECRIETEDSLKGGQYSGKDRADASCYGKHRNLSPESYKQPLGRFPANFIHDGSQMVMELFPQTKSGKDVNPTKGPTMNRWLGPNSKYLGVNYGDNGSAARFFYCAKASKAERDRGLGDMPNVEGAHVNQSGRRYGGGNRENWQDPYKRPTVKNNHPTVKPLALMTYLVKLVKMPGYNLIVDSFMGSGTTLLACIRLGIPCIGIDNDEKSCEIAAKRCSPK